MVLLILFAFLAGVVTILSPCILPVLPVVLSGTVGGGHRKPLGIVTGFVASFTFFTLFLSAIVQATGLPADSLRTVSIVLIGLFGISLLVPRVQFAIEIAFSKLANMGPKGNSGEGFISGVLVGLSLGLVWTPCVGPILASVISLAITGSVTGSAFLITLAYSLGTAIPMLAITYGGRQLLTRVPWLLRNTATIQKGFGVLMILTAIAIATNADRRFQTFVLDTFPNYGTGLTVIEDNDTIRTQLDALRDSQREPAGEGSTGDQPSGSVPALGKPMGIENSYPLAPEIIPGGEWYNSAPRTLQELRGKVVLIDFWTYTCINCIRTLPYLKSWHEKYADDGLVIIGVHSPEFAFEKDPGNVRKAIADFGLEYPIVQDNDFATWRAYDNRYWPAKYFIDKNGRVRGSHFGEGEYNESERMIQELLAETGAKVEVPIDNPAYILEQRTPELYLGYGRMEYGTNATQAGRDKEYAYTFPTVQKENTFSFDGTWEIMEEYSGAQSGASLMLNFFAKDVFLVMRSVDGSPKRVVVTLDGESPGPVTTGEDLKDGTVTVTTDRLYRLIEAGSAKQGVLQLEFPDGGVEVYAFTFG
jgi:cytochrome c biogenesis protein CcdA/thiol-disulfide isomerase/thioredoxin